MRRCNRFSRQPSATRLGRQPVEQFADATAVRRGRRSRSRSARAPAEVVLPEPVDDHAGRQRVVGPGEPRAQSRAAGRCWSRSAAMRGRLPSSRRGQKPGFTSSPGLVRSPRRQQARLAAGRAGRSAPSPRAAGPASSPSNAFNLRLNRGQTRACLGGRAPWRSRRARRRAGVRPCRRRISC